MTNNEIQRFLLKEGCLMRAIHKSFQIMDKSLITFVSECLSNGALNQKTLLIHHDAMCSYLEQLTLKRVTYSFASSIDEVRNINQRLINEGGSFKIHIFKCFWLNTKTHFIEVNLNDECLYDSEFNSILRHTSSNVSYRVYIERSCV